MSLATLIPKVWAARLIANLNDQLVYGRAISRDYQPDAEFGNVIDINQIGDVAIGDYTKDTDFAAGPETLDSTDQDLLINQQKFFNFQIDNIDTAQQKPKVMDAAMARAAYAMAKVVDTYIASLYTSFTNSIGVVGTPVTPDDTDIYQYFTQAAKLLDEAAVPTYGRYAIVNAAGIKLLKDSGVYLSDTPAGDTVRYMGQFMNANELPMGWKGQAAGFELFMSNDTPAEATPTASTSIWTFGHSMGIQMVDSVNNIVGYTPEKRFADAMKGLYVFGAKVTQPTAGVKMYTTL